MSRRWPQLVTSVKGMLYSAGAVVAQAPIYALKTIASEDIAKIQ